MTCAFHLAPLPYVAPAATLIYSFLHLFCRLQQMAVVICGIAIKISWCVWRGSFTLGAFVEEHTDVCSSSKVLGWKQRQQTSKDPPLLASGWPIHLHLIDNTPFRYPRTLTSNPNQTSSSCWNCQSRMWLLVGRLTNIQQVARLKSSYRLSPG